MDDEQVTYKAYEKFAKAGIMQRLHPQGPVPAVGREAVSAPARLLRRARRGKAAKDWPQLNFIIYHSAYRFAGGGTADDAWAQFEQTGRIEWVTDLAEIPAKHGVNNVYADLGQIFAQSMVAEPAAGRGDDGQLDPGARRRPRRAGAPTPSGPARRSGRSRRCAGSRSPKIMQKKYGFKPLGPADGPIKTAILGENNARLYKYDRRAALATDRVAVAKAAYEESGGQRSNLRYGYVVGARA